MAPKPVIYRIHPAIGFARVGAGAQFFIGPEVPGYGATGADGGFGSSVPPYKESAGKLKRQAARFRVWRYTWVDAAKAYVPDDQDLTIGGGVKDIRWTVALANRKASFFEFHGTNGEDPGAAFIKARRNSKIVAQRDTKLELSAQNDVAGKSAPAKELKPSVPGIPIDYLGEIRTDGSGRLVVLGGRGVAKASTAVATAVGIVGAAPLAQYANNRAWFDDVSDGPVTAEIQLDDGSWVRSHEIEPAWVVCGPPDFAPPLRSIVSLYDTLVDLWVRSPTLDASAASGAPAWMTAMRGDFTATSGFSKFKPDFVRDIYPFLQAVRNTRWVNSTFALAHGWDWAKLANPGPAGDATRTAVFERLRKPPSLSSLSAGARADMPRLMGDEETDEASKDPKLEDGTPGAPRRPVSAASTAGGLKSWLTLTPVQYALLRQWKLGKFDKGAWPASNDPADLPAPPKKPTPWGLDQAALENCVGGAFFPGIEVGWLVRNPSLYEVSASHASVFRVNQWQRRANGDPILAAGRPQVRTMRYGPSSAAAGGVDLRVEAGYFTQQMAVPWHADFLSCYSYAHEGASAAWWPAQRPDDVEVTTLPLPMSAADLTAYNASPPGMEAWLGDTAASPGVPARVGTIDAREKLIEHFQKLGFVSAADTIGDKRPNRNTTYVERERDSIPP